MTKLIMAGCAVLVACGVISLPAMTSLRDKLIRIVQPEWKLVGSCFVELSDPEPWESRDPRLMVHIEENGKRGVRYAHLGCKIDPSKLCIGVIDKDKLLKGDGYSRSTCIEEGVVDYAYSNQTAPGKVGLPASDNNRMNAPGLSTNETTGAALPVGSAASPIPKSDTSSSEPSVRPPEILID